MGFPILNLAPLTPARPVSFITSLPHRTRSAILVMLLVVLPLHSVLQLVAGVRAHRHVHSGAPFSAGGGLPASPLARLAEPLRVVLQALHAAQEPRLARPAAYRSQALGVWGGLHQHGGVYHTHTADTHDVIDLSGPADDPLQAGATAFLAWIPAGMVLPAAGSSTLLAAPAPRWHDRLVAPPLMPPRR